MTVALVCLPACIFSLVLLWIVWYFTSDIPSTVSDFIQGGLDVWGSVCKLAGNERSKSDPKYRLFFSYTHHGIAKNSNFSSSLRTFCPLWFVFKLHFWLWKQHIILNRLWGNLLFPRSVISYETQSSLSKKSFNAQRVLPAAEEFSLNAKKTQDSFLTLWSSLWWWELLS